MLQIDSKQFAELGLAHERQHRATQPQRIAQQLRRDHPQLMASRTDEAALLAELGEALARCDELGLQDDEDRRIFCQWDQLLVPGMRHLPQWPQWLAHCRQRAQPGERSVLLRLLLETPPAWWQRQFQQHEAARLARGLPSLDDAVAASAQGRRP